MHQLGLGMFPEPETRRVFPKGAIKPALRPPFPWPGGKQYQAQSVVRAISRHHGLGFNAYWEPFCGAAAVYFKLNSLWYAPKGAAHLSDRDDRLVAVWRAIQEDPGEVQAAYDRLLIQRGAGWFASVRQSLNDTVSLTAAEFAARWIYVRCASFHGKGGSYDHRKEQWLKKRFASVAVAISRVEFAEREYEDIQPAAGDLVYCDPPYFGLEQPYRGRSWGLGDHKRFLAVAAGWQAAGVHVVITHADCELYRDMPGNWRTIEMLSRRRLGQRKGKAPPVVRELIISGRGAGQ